MSIGDWFRRRAPSAPEASSPATGRRFHDDRGQMFDLEKTAMLEALFRVPREQRDDGWLHTFFDAAWCASVALTEPNIFTGPDGFPYLRLDVPRPETSFDSQCLANLAGNCRDHGVGAAFFASPDDPPEAAQFVLSLGLIDSLMRYDSPEGDPIDVAEAAEGQDDSVFSFETGQWSETLTTRAEHNILVGTPSADFLPPPLARSLYRHLTDGWGMDDPRVGLVADMHMRPHRSLVIGRKRSEFPADAPIDDMVRALIWHLTPNRMLMLAPEQFSIADMAPLKDLFEDR